MPEHTPTVSTENENPQLKTEDIVNGTSKMTKELLKSIEGKNIPASRAPDTIINNFENIELKESEDEVKVAVEKLNLIESESPDLNHSEKQNEKINEKRKSIFNERYPITKLLPDNIVNMLNSSWVAPNVIWFTIWWIESATAVLKLTVALGIDLITLLFDIKN